MTHKPKSSKNKKTVLYLLTGLVLLMALIFFCAILYLSYYKNSSEKFVKKSLINTLIKLNNTEPRSEVISVKYNPNKTSTDSDSTTIKLNSESLLSKSAGSATVTINVIGKEVTTDFDYILVDDSLYLKLKDPTTNLKDLVVQYPEFSKYKAYAQEIIDKLSNKWIEFNSKDDIGINLDCLTLVGPSNIPLNQDEIMSAYNNNQFITKVSSLGVDKVQNRSAKHYELIIDTAKLSDFFISLIDGSENKSGTCTKVISNNLNQQGEKPIDVWIDDQTSSIIKITTPVNSDEYIIEYLQTKPQKTLDKVDKPDSYIPVKTVKNSIEQIIGPLPN